jgi:hypothetical protein
MLRDVRARALVAASLGCLVLSARIALAEPSSTPAATSTDRSAAKASQASKKTKGKPRQRRPKRSAHEGDEDDNGVIYTK